MNGCLYITFFILAFVLFVNHRFGVSGFIFIAVFLVIIGLIAMYSENAKKEDEQQEQIKFDSEINNLILKHKNIVVRAYRHTVSETSFGDKNYKRFMKDFEDYFSNRLTFSMEAFLQNNSMTWESMCQQNSVTFPKKVEWLLGRQLKQANATFKTPREYELYCANQFEKAGWVAKATQATADQGVDVLASKKERKLAAQCKRFSRAVGNKAVQEIVAGMRHYDCREGVVIAPNGFTKSAQQLAKSNNVKLIHHDEICNI